jgi:diketogulonate reductase-like aldo/keto reductase
VPPATGARLTERNLKIAREVDAVADELGATSAQVAVAWLRQRGQRIIPSSASRKIEQLQDVLGSPEGTATSGPTRPLDKSSRIEFGFAYSLLSGPEGKVVQGDLRAASRPAGCGTYRWPT